MFNFPKSKSLFSSIYGEPAGETSKKFFNMPYYKLIKELDRMMI